MVWPIIGRCVAFGSLHLTDAASASQRMAALARACRTRNTWPERGYLPKWLHSAFRFEPRCDNSRMVGQIGIGAAVTRRPLPHHRAYGSVHGGSGWLR